MQYRSAFFRFLSVLGFGVCLLSFFPVVSAYAEYSSNSTNYQVFVGGTKAWPNLGESNRAIHDVENELREMAPGVKTFEDWHDVYSGSVGIGIARRFRVYGRDVWPCLSVAYANGDVKSSQNGLPTYLGVPMSYSFRQEYTYWSLESGFLLSLLEWEGFVWKLQAYFSLNWLHSDTTFKLDIPHAGLSRRVDAEFDDMQPGYAIGTSVEYNFLSWLGVMVSARYNWCRYRGDTDTEDTTIVTGLVPATQKYSIDTLVDTSGLSVGGYLLINF